MTAKDDASKPQRDRFIEKARELGCDEDEDRFVTLKRVATAEPKKDTGQPKRPQ